MRSWKYLGYALPLLVLASACGEGGPTAPNPVAQHGASFAKGANLSQDSVVVPPELGHFLKPIFALSGVRRSHMLSTVAYANEEPCAPDAFYCGSVGTNPTATPYSYTPGDTTFIDIDGGVYNQMRYETVVAWYDAPNHTQWGDQLVFEVGREGRHRMPISPYRLYDVNPDPQVYGDFNTVTIYQYYATTSFNCLFGCWHYVAQQIIGPLDNGIRHTVPDNAAFTMYWQHR